MLPRISVLVLGDIGSGKTTLIRAFCPEASIASSPVTRAQRLLVMPDQEYTCEVSEHEPGSSIRDAEAYVVLYRRNAANSYTNAKLIVSSISDIFQAMPRPIVLVGTHGDLEEATLEDGSTISKDALRFVQEIGGHFTSFCETTSSITESVKTPFEEAVSMSMRRRRHLTEPQNVKKTRSCTIL